MKNTFICLLPRREDAVRLHATFDALFSLRAFPYIKLPLHVTLYFFPVLTAKQYTDVSMWLQKRGEMSKGPIIVDAESMRCFKKDDRDFVCHLPVFSEQIINLHDDLFARFKHIHTDSFDFVPHLSLFYPNRNLSEEEKAEVQNIYSEFQSITFDRVAFAAEKEHGTHFLDVQTI